MPNTCRHGRPYNVTCDFCKVEGTRSERTYVPPQWKVPKAQQIQTPVCKDCKPFVVFSTSGDLYAHLQGHIDAVKGGPSAPTFRLDTTFWSRSSVQPKPKITLVDKVKLQALLDTQSRSQPVPMPSPTPPGQPVKPRQPVIVKPSDEEEPAHLITPHVFAPPSASLTLCRKCMRSQGNYVHIEANPMPIPDRIIKVCLIIGGAIALIGIAFSVLILFKVPSSYYMPWYW